MEMREDSSASGESLEAIQHAKVYISHGIGNISTSMEIVGYRGDRREIVPLIQVG